MKEIWLPMDAGVVAVTFKQQEGLEANDQIVFEKKPISLPVGFAYKPPKPKRPPK